MTKDKEYPQYNEEDSGILTAGEPAATYACEPAAMPDDVAYAQIMDGVLQVTSDVEEEIAAAERGETISLDEFKTLFAPWIGK
jgi:hypothetical protein